MKAAAVLLKFCEASFSRELRNLLRLCSSAAREILRRGFGCVKYFANVSGFVPVGCDAHLTDPPKNNFWIRVNSHTAVDYGIRMGDEMVTRKGKASLVRLCSPNLTRRHHFKSLYVDLFIRLW